MKPLIIVLVLFIVLNIFPKHEAELFSTNSEFGWQAQPRAFGFGFPIAFIKYYLTDAKDITAPDLYGRNVTVQEWCKSVNANLPQNLTDCYIKKGDIRFVNNIFIFLNIPFWVFVSIVTYGAFLLIKKEKSKK